MQLIALTLLFFSFANVATAETQSFKKKDPCSIFVFTKYDVEFNCLKKYCRNMLSCKEACYQFKVCGYRRLDRDKDGSPCDNVCDRK